ncbi:MAG: P-II family nitrogen regulator [Firmicutes bacterium]|nr:P-II family nitrogen regulator [Bacillota bacterium]
MKTYGIDLIVTIANRNRIEKFIQLYREHGMSFNITAFGRGTASSDVLKFLGLDASEKAILFSAVSRTRSREVIRDAILKTRIDVPGNGILMTIPLSAAGGGRCIQYLTQGQEKEGENLMKNLQEEVRKESEEKKEETFNPSFHLIIAITNEGYSDQVMDAARSVGASGGTIVRAKGTDKATAEKFFGVSLAAEKEMVFIVAKAKERNVIMSEIIRQAGMDSDAKSIVFSLPVDRIAGLRLLEDDDSSL